MVLTLRDSNTGSTMGKVRLITKLSNAATSEYDLKDALMDEDDAVDEKLFGNNNHNNSKYDDLDTPVNKNKTYSGGDGGSRPTSPSTRNNNNSGGGLFGFGIGSSNNNSVAGYVEGGGSTTSGMQASTLKVNTDYLLQSQASIALEKLNCPKVMLLITAIGAIDIAPAHSFAANSPFVNVACGKVVASTPVNTIKNNYYRIRCDFVICMTLSYMDDNKSIYV